MAASIEQVKQVEVVHMARDVKEKIELRRRAVALEFEKIEVERGPLALRVVSGDESAKVELDIFERQLTDLEGELQMLDSALKAQIDVIANAEAKLHLLGKDDRRKEFVKLVKRRAEAVAAIEAAIAAEAKAQRELIDVNSRMLVVNLGPFPGGTLTETGATMKALAEERWRVAPVIPTVATIYPGLLGHASGVMKAPKDVPLLTQVFADADAFVLQLIEGKTAPIVSDTETPLVTGVEAVSIVDDFAAWPAEETAAPEPPAETFDARTYVVPRRTLAIP